MSKAKLNIWDREFELEVTYDCYSNEEITTSQEEAVRDFINAIAAIKDSLDKVKGYCLRNNRDDIGKDSIDNVFKYVEPKYLYVARDEKKHVVAIMCNYKFDTENGIAVVFENEKFFKVGKQNIIL